MTEQKQRAPRRRKTLTESLLEITLMLEAFVVFFAGLVIFGLKILDPWLVLWLSLGYIVALVLTSRVLRYPWGVWIGWALQLVLVASGMLLPIMFVVAAAFVGLWVFCLVKGGQIDRRNALIVAAASEQPAASE